MKTSPYLRNVIHRKQTLSDYEYFDEQASLSFTDSGPSWLDVRLDIRPQHQKKLSGDALLASEKVVSVGDKLPLEGSLDRPPLLRVSHAGDLERILRGDSTRLQIFFVRQRNSRSRLSVSRTLFDALCDSCGVFEKIHEYVLCFGIKSSDVHLNPPAMRFHFLSDCDPLSSHLLAEEFEGAYVVRFVEPNHRIDGVPWSLRQSGVYHQFRGHQKSSTWIFLALSTTLEKQLDAYLSATTAENDLNAFEIHFIILDSAMAGWRGCIAYLGEEIQKQSDLVFMAEFEMDDFTVTRLEERQYIKKIEDLILDIVTAISFMLANLDAIIEFYCSSKRRYTDMDLQSTTDAESGEEGGFDSVLAGFEQRRRDLLLFQAQTEALQRKVQSVSNLVSNILDLNNGNALKLLAIETRLENANMAVLTKKSVQDAATVKVLTIITLVYLPLTVVTNFFSTSFINTATRTDGSMQITVTSDLWILFAAGVPLTVLTVCIWWIFAQKEIKGRYPGRLENVVQHTRAALSRSGRLRNSPSDIEKRNTD